MAERSLTEEIITIVESVSNNNPAPVPCSIWKINTARERVDVITDNDEPFLNLRVIGNNFNVGDFGIIVFCNGNYEDGVVITR